MLEVPVRQYKEYSLWQKADRARRLAEWLAAQKERGLTLTGFVHAHTQCAAAQLGLELIEELPNTRVEPHYDTYRLFFDNEHIDFAQAVALQYYLFTVYFGVLRAALRMPPQHRKLYIAMDRFPGAGTGDAEPGELIPQTQGAKFVEYSRTRSKTGMEILEKNNSENIESTFGSIDWWKRRENDPWNEGKSHPHFVLPDWLAAAAIIRNFREDFVAANPSGNVIADALEELHDVFKTFEFWSMDANVLPHIRANEKLWEVPDDAREFILARAGCAE